MNVETIGQVILWAISVVAFVAAAAVYLRGSADKGTIASLENSVSALKLEGELKDKKIQGLQDELDRVKLQGVSLGRQVHTLQGVVTQAAEVARLQETLDTNHAEAMAHWRVIEEAISHGR